ncbi:MAG: hypothetical protein VX947_04210 [Chloroflexota bacterium]|nr:hypothetical protein [Chloroflexota bacterium]MEC9287932.1 hypothetical protein [Chloroflexota bacterium]
MLSPIGAYREDLDEFEIPEIPVLLKLQVQRYNTRSQTVLPMEHQDRI